MIGLVLAAAGTGSRFASGLPKQFTDVQGKPLYLHALELFSTFFDQAIIVLPQAWKEEVESQVQLLPYQDKLILEVGGPQRQDSVGRGLSRLSDGIRTVLVHDAVRPFTSAHLISRVIDETRRHQACIPVLPLRDTIKEVCDGRIARTLDRESLGLAQTPQGFEINLLKRAFAQAKRDGFHGTDEAALVERLGVPVHVVPGDRANIKVTWKEDL
ncbi:2-C-methyl-D-erythritol 4-phosphate cytidylyltransferase [Acidobacteria bacterium AH-259-G07]|nr:2-C-methyl-D-erythritol 4-phosphate cytidylyltransferase [Acidobacteria bacterium AH-259-G07]